MAFVDTRIPLTQCDIPSIHLENQEFELNREQPVGKGGTCLVYEAVQKDRSGLGRRVILKEFYPASPESGSWRDPDSGKLSLPAQESIQDQRQRFCRSYELFKALFNEAELNLYTVQAQGHIQGNGTEYLVVDYGSGMTLEGYMALQPCLFDFLARMRVLALVLEKLHKRGFVHMDMKPDNLLCYAQHDVVKLLDTDSLLEKKIFAGKAVEVILSGSQGYTAPEVRELAQGLEEDWLGCYEERHQFAELGHRADIYSFGVILNRFFRKDCPKEAPLEACLRQKEPYLSARAVRSMEKLLDKTMARDPENRYESMAQVALALEDLLGHLDPKKPMLAQRFSGESFPVLGREEMLAQMEAVLKAQSSQGSRILCLSGIGGVGKSVLARLYARRHQQEYDVVTEVAALSAEEAVNQLTILNWEPEPGLSEEDYWKRHKKMVRNLCAEQKVLILVHDYDVSEDNIALWRELNCDILLTSRHDWTGSGIATIRLRCADLSVEQAEAIFERYYLQNCETQAQYLRLSGILSQEKAELTKLVRQVDAHPMTLMLLARYMTDVPGQELGPKNVLEEWHKKRIFAEDSPRTFPQEQDDAVQMNNVCGHLTKLFRQELERSGFCEEEILALRHMLLCPSEYGISSVRFADWCDMEADWLERLRKRGWLEYLPWQQDVLRPEAAPGVYIMPRVLQQVLGKVPGISIRPSDVDLYSAGLYQRFRKEERFLQRQAILVHMEQVLTLPEETTAEYLQYLLMLLEMYNTLTKLKKREQIITQILHIYDQLSSSDREDPDLKMAVKMLQKADMLRKGLWKELLAQEKKKMVFSSLAEAVQEVYLRFECGRITDALKLAKQVRARCWRGASLWDQICFQAAMTRIYSKLGLRSRAETEISRLTERYREYGSEDASMDLIFYQAASEYIPLLLEEDCPQQTMELVSQLQQSACEKLGPEHMIAVRLNNQMADTCVLQKDPATAAEHRKQAIVGTQNPFEKLTWTLHLALDYGNREPELRDAALKQALTLCRNILRKDGKDRQSERLQELITYYIAPSSGMKIAQLVPRLARTKARDGFGYIDRHTALITTAAELAAFYYSSAADAVEAGLIPSGLDLLRDWLRLVRRADSFYMQRDAYFMAAAEIFRRFGLKEEACWYRQAITGQLPWSHDQGNIPFDLWVRDFIGEEYFRLEKLATKNKIHIPIR